MYCPTCFFSNERESVTYGDPTWRNCFNEAQSYSCRSCGVEVSSCSRSKWLNEHVVAAVSEEMVYAYTDATCDLMESALRGRWLGARVVARCEEILQCGDSVSRV